MLLEMFFCCCILDDFCQEIEQDIEDIQNDYARDIENLKEEVAYLRSQINAD